MMRLLVAACLLMLSACDRQETPPPSPAAQTAQAQGYYCGMLLSGHDGPKAQIWLRSGSAPLWFTSVRDAVIFTRLPEEPRDIAAFYVHDMERAQSWAAPGDDAFIDAFSAFYVIGSARRGGMGAPETVPFARREAAEAFADAEGGEVVTMSGIPDSYLFAPAMDKDDGPDHDGHQTEGRKS